jgi:predicted metal-binding membrane protein
VHSASPVAALSRRDRFLISACLALITALAWAYLVHLDRQMSSSIQYDTMMAEMGMSMDRPWTPRDVLFTFMMWTVMMVGMMAGSAAPVLLLFGAAARARRGERACPDGAHVWTCYLVVWVGFSACAALAQWPAPGGAVVAGDVGVEPAAGRCDPHRRGRIADALGRVPTVPKPAGTGDQLARREQGALGMGIGHGVFCLGCCGP